MNDQPMNEECTIYVDETQVLETEWIKAVNVKPANIETLHDTREPVVILGRTIQTRLTNPIVFFLFLTGFLLVILVIMTVFSK